MYKLTRPGQFIYAIGMMALAILSLMMGDLIIGRPPVWSEGIAGKTAWAYGASAIIIICGFAILFNVKAGWASIIIGCLVLISFFFRHLPLLIKGPGEAILWSLNAYKTLALAGGGFIVAASFFKEEGRNGHSVLSNARLVWTGAIFMSCFFILCGFAHFKFDAFIIDTFMPKYIPFPAFWTYFCGVALIAGGIGILIPPVRKWSAFLSGIMVLGWFLILHIPRFLANQNDPGDQMGLCESFTIAGIFFVLAGLFTTEITGIFKK